MSNEVMNASERSVITQSKYRRAKQLIPGGTQLLSKRPEMHAPDRWPAYYRTANGCEVVDLDGNTYLDMSLMGVGACLLGYADPDVCEAVIRRVRDGAMSTLNAPDEVQLAEDLLQLHGWADQARFMRTGGEAMAASIRIARAATGRDVIAFCGYHGWHDWYLAANRNASGECNSLTGHLLPGLSPAGVPRQLAGTSYPFTYNKLDELELIVGQQGDRLAAVVMEPTRSVDPQPGFLEGVRALCDQCGALLVFDEISAGWRFHFGGAHLKYCQSPDLAVFGKALGNGHPIAAVIGKAAAMNAVQDSFISSTYWTEAVGPAAALATIGKMKLNDIPTHAAEIGTQFRTGLQSLAESQEIPIKITGHPALMTIAFECQESAAVMTLFTVRMLERGILCGSSFYPSFAHNANHVRMYLNAAEEVLAEVADSIECGDALTRIEGRVKSTGFRRLT